MNGIKTISFNELDESFFSTTRLSDDENNTKVTDKVSSIIQAVRANGDVAVRNFASQFDRANPKSFLIPQNVLKTAEYKLKAENPELHKALCLSFELVKKFALAQKESFNNFEIEIEPGMFTGQKTIPVDRAGVYVPAGRFPLLSSVIMCTTPAIVAGVKDVILCTPPRENPDGSNEPYADEGIMAAASICGVNAVYACGGAQAIAAMAYGTESIPRADVIVGPGNKFVAEAKRLVYGQCGIDMVAGPTEVMILADESANPAWIAADMLAQAEHDVDAQAVLVTPSQTLADKVLVQIEEQLKVLATRENAEKSLAKHGRIIIVDNAEQAAEVANKKAPEHLELAFDDGPTRDLLMSLVHNYGSLFVGHHSAEVLGDYAAGLNHTLPTATSARFTGGLSVRVFLKTVTTLRIADENASGYKNSLNAAEIIGHAEGLEAHANAATIRKK